ncbi:MAG: amidohydrolase [Gemmatimonadales bacterium]
MSRFDLGQARWIAFWVGILLLVGCAVTGTEGDDAGAGTEGPVEGRAPFESSYTPQPTKPVVIRGATVLTGTGVRLERADVVLRDGLIAVIGSAEVPRGAEIVDGSGKWVTPGIIDVHSHLGDYPAPSGRAHSDGNESTSPNTAEVWAEHSVWPQDPQFPRALAGGVTTLQVLPGSANLFGGRGVTLKNVPSRTVQGMKFPGAPHGLKMACGENPKRTYGRRNRAPSTRMGNVAGYRKAWIDAADYRRKIAEDPDDPPKRDLKLETLAGVLDGEIIVHNHCYRADEMAIMIDIAREFGYRIGTFHHAVEAYKVADLLRAEEICAAMWVDWWGRKLEQFDAVRENVALVAHAGACAIVHSDDPTDIQRLNQEAAKAMSAGQRMGLPFTQADAIGWITSNPARALGIDSRTGTIEVGKAADVVVWDGDPFSVYSRAEKVYIDGYLYYDRENTARQPVTDFELGLTPEGRRP